MRISFLDEVFYPTIGGGEIFVREVGKRLVQNGIEVEVYTSRVKSLPKEDSLDGIRIHRLRTAPDKLDFMLSAKFKLRNEKFDIVSSTSPISRLVCDKLKRRIFLGNVFAYWGPAWKKFENPITGTIKHKFEDYTLTHPKFDVLVSSNAAFCKTAQNLGITAPIKVVPSGVDLAKYSKPSKKSRKSLGLPEGKLLLFVGRVINIKGLEYLMKALEKSDYSLAIIGDGPELGKIRRLAEWNEINLIAPGQKDPLHYYKACDAFILPSIMEGLPLTILEAFAAGKPVIASNVAGIPEVVKDGKNGFLTEPRNPKSIRTAIDKLFDSSSNYQKLCKNAKETAKDYSWDSIAQKFEKVVRAL